ncbi:MAG TPA: Uma2 family endonuclease [Planctomycetaceae bacterium]|nr:Uma2 family endonuclease [Planctomycetaceae bacterium]
MTTATRIGLADFDRMIAEGQFPPGPKRHRIELIEGELRPMSPIGPIHERLVDVLTEWSLTALPRGTAWVRIQNSIGIPSLDSAPEPDVCWVRRRDYSTGRPLPDDVLLVIEVSDTSLVYDCGQKADLFAAAGVVDYWVVKIPDKCVEVFRQPGGKRYSDRRIYRAPEEIRPLNFPQLALPMQLLFAS